MVEIVTLETLGFEERVRIVVDNCTFLIVRKDTMTPK
jgi:hypothetical protein